MSFQKRAGQNAWRILTTAALVAAGLGWGALTSGQGPKTATASSPDILATLPLPEPDDPAASGPFPQTRHVVIMVMDGGRYDHTLGDSERRYIPRISTALEPRGVVYSRFYNTGHTITTSGHATLATGKTHHVYGEAFGKFTGRTMLELAREQKGLPQDAVWLLFGKTKLKDVFNRSLPTSPYRPSIWGIEGDDLAVAEHLWEVLDTHRPVLTLANFPSVDRRAHQGDWQGYLEAISRFDILAVETWRRIQADPALKDRTTLIITNDHGRRYDDWREHGDDSEGSRRIMFLAIGPDVKPGVIDATPKDHEDLAATVGLLLDIDIPDRDGEAMTELFQPR